MDISKLIEYLLLKERANMSTTKDSNGNTVRTEQGYSSNDTVRYTYDSGGNCIDIAYQKGDDTRSYTGVNHGIFGPTPSGTLKK